MPEATITPSLEDKTPVKDVLKKAERKSKLSQEEIHDALAWFQASEQDPDAEAEPKSLRLNMGTRDEPEWIRWVIAPVDDTVITAIRDKSRKGGNRKARRSGSTDAEVDEMLVARRMVVEGTLEPDMPTLTKLAGLVDPADALQAFFKKKGKTGLITQLSGEILSISGWDDEDIEEVEAAQG